MIAHFLEAFRRPQGPSIQDLRRGFYGELIALQLPEQISEFNLEPIRINLNLAMEQGIKPVSVAETMEQLPNVELSNMVMFDSVGIHPGNHWRVEAIEGSTAVLLHCGGFGLMQSDRELRVLVPTSEPMFTGVSIPNFRVHGQDVGLDHAAAMVRSAWFEATSPFANWYPSELHFNDKTILFADAKGTLTLRLPTAV